MKKLLKPECGLRIRWHWYNDVNFSLLMTTLQLGKKMLFFFFLQEINTEELKGLPVETYFQMVQENKFFWHVNLMWIIYVFVCFLKHNVPQGLSFPAHP